VLLWGTLAVSTIDNIIKPLIISRGVDLPFVLVLLGVLGGAIAFGFIGIFLGPVRLAVGYALLMDWAASRGRIELVTPADADRNGATRGVIERIGPEAREPASRLRD
jgi:predicted PurR-regulated permease PerM